MSTTPTRSNTSPPGGRQQLESLTPPCELTRQKLLSLGVLWPGEVDRICDEETGARFVVEGFLPVKSIGIAAGESTIGKSPLMYQLGLCVAAGVPFLGMPTTQGRVLYFDLENGILDSKMMRDALVRFLGLYHAPENFLLVTDPSRGLERLIAEIKPDLVIIDSLRAFAPEATDTNRAAAEWLNSLRRLARKYGTAGSQSRSPLAQAQRRPFK